MINKEVAELRRRFKQDRGNISTIYGCYVNTRGEIITKFKETLEMMPLDEQEKYLNLLKKALGGSMGKTLNDIVFRTQQVVDSDEHRLLMQLRKSKLTDEEALDRLYNKIAMSLELDVNYLILMAFDCYDVPYKSSDGEYQSDAGDTQHNYFVCSICPVKETNAVLHYDSAAAAFRDRGVDWVVYPPELGFTFPAFDDRATNIYSALYYSRSAVTGYDTFLNNIFNVRPIMPVNAQRDTFKGVLAEALGDDCSADLVQDIHSELHGIVTEHKEAKIPETLKLSSKQVQQIITACGVDSGKVEDFAGRYAAAFGEDAEIPPQNLMNDRMLEYRTPDVVIKVNPDRQDLIHARTINGVKYLLVNVSEGVEINGIGVTIPSDRKTEEPAPAL